MIAVRALRGQIWAELTLLLRDRTVLLFSFLIPLLTVVFFGYLNRGGHVGAMSYSSFLTAGGVGMMVSSAAFQHQSTALARQRDNGVLKRLAGTPLAVWALVGSKVIVATAVTVLEALILVGANVLLFGAQVGCRPLLALSILLLGVAGFSALGVALAGVCRNADMASAAGMAIALPMQFLCGTLFPLEGMPEILQRIAQILPLTYLVNALRGALTVGVLPVAQTRDYLVLLGVVVVGGTLAAATFRWE